MRIWTIVAILVGVFSICHFSLASMSSSSYQILWDTISSGGSDTSSSASYILRDTVGNSGAGTSNSTNYDLEAGYRAGIFDQFLSFSLFSQSVAPTTTATALTGDIVTADTSGFLVGDYIAITQDLGVNQIAAIGKIESIGIGTITVDNWKNGGVTPTIDGSNDYVYELSGTSVALGNFSTSSVKTAIIGFEMTIDVESGYTVQVMSDGDLLSGANTIDAVADGSVSIGSEEYGAKSSDTTLSDSTFDSEDSAFTTSYQDIADESSFQFASRNFLTLKTAISSSTVAGTYGQVLTFIGSANF
jgi:hypothetical protein